MAWRTIRRNSKRVSRIFAQASKCEHYCWDSFAGIPCNISEASDALRKHPSARLKELGDERFQISISTNNWYEFESTA